MNTFQKNIYIALINYNYFLVVKIHHLDIAETQRENNVRDHTPNFLPCALSHEGEFSGGAIQAIEHFTLVFKETYEDGTLIK